MKLLIDEVRTAHREFIRNMHGIVPNRLLMNADTAERFKAELLIACLYHAEHQLTRRQVIYEGMRLVEDENTIGIEVAYAR